MKNNLQVRMQMVEGDPMLCLGGADCGFVFFHEILCPADGGASFSNNYGSVENDHVGDETHFLGLFLFPYVHDS